MSGRPGSGGVSLFWCPAGRFCLGSPRGGWGGNVPLLPVAWVVGPSGAVVVILGVAEAVVYSGVPRLRAFAEVSCFSLGAAEVVRPAFPSA